MCRLKIIVIGCLSAILTACVSVPEATSEFDYVFGADYVPPVFEISDQPFRRALLLPVFPEANSAHARHFFDAFKRSIQAFEIVGGEPYLTHMPAHEEVLTQASIHQCDAVLLVRITQHSPYTPLRLQMEVVLERLEDNLTLWKGSADYDANNRFVSNSARRYVQRIQQKNYSPDKSLSVLRHFPTFLDYASFDLAQRLDRLAADIAHPMPKPTQKPLNQQLNQKESAQTTLPSSPSDSGGTIRKIRASSR